MDIDFDSISVEPPTPAIELSNNALDHYRDLMIDIKCRSDFIDQLSTQLPHHIGWLESISLQIRKQLEGIAFACFIANAQHMPVNIAKRYNPNHILSKLDEVVSDCWPEPLLTNVPEPAERKHPRDAGRIDSRPTGDWLTRDELRGIYGQLGNLLHNRNPLRRGAVDIEYFVNRAPLWHFKIINLLTKHKIAINSEEEMYVVQISPDGVSISTFVKIAELGN